MEKTDARKLSSEVQYALRQQIVRLRKQGRPNREVAHIIGVTERHTSKIWQTYIREGSSAIKLGQRGRRYGGSRRLLKEQEIELKRLLVDKMPDQIKLPFALWNRDAIRLAIKQRYGTDLPLRTITDYLKRWDFTPQKPVKRAYEQNPRRVQQWLENTYPGIESQAKQQKAEIHWGEETGIKNDAYNAKGFSPRGKTPVVRLHAKKCGINMISSITNQGKVRFMLYRETMTSEMFIKFLSRLAKDAQRKVFLILDNLRVHHGKDVKEWLEKNKEKMEVFYLPSYSPELNPDEYLNGDLKQRIRSGMPARTEKDIVKKTHSFMKTLQKRSHYVKNYFKHPKVAYAA
jgi:transposase